MEICKLQGQILERIVKADFDICKRNSNICVRNSTNVYFSKRMHHWIQIYEQTRSLGALRAPTSNWWPFGPAWLRPSRPSGAQAVWPTQWCGHWIASLQCIGGLLTFVNNFFLDLSTKITNVPITLSNDHIIVWVPEGREGRSQAGP